MRDLTFEWYEFKDIQTQIMAQVFYVQNSVSPNSYVVFLSTEHFTAKCSVQSADAADFEHNFRKNGVEAFTEEGAFAQCLLQGNRKEDTSMLPSFRQSVKEFVPSIPFIP